MVGEGGPCISIPESAVLLAPGREKRGRDRAGHFVLPIYARMCACGCACIWYFDSMFLYHIARRCTEPSNNNFSAEKSKQKTSWV